MALKSILVDSSTGKDIETIDGIFGTPNIGVTDHYVGSTRFKSQYRTSAGTTEITAPNINGAIILTDIIVTTDRVANSRLMVFFDDGVHTTVIADGVANDAPINFAIGFHGGWTGWKDAALKMTTVAALKANVAVGYIKIPNGLEYLEWDALR